MREVQARSGALCAGEESAFSRWGGDTPAEFSNRQLVAEQRLAAVHFDTSIERSKNFSQGVLDTALHYGKLIPAFRIVRLQKHRGWKMEVSTSLSTTSLGRTDRSLSTTFAAIEEVARGGGGQVHA